MTIWNDAVVMMADDCGMSVMILVGFVFYVFFIFIIVISHYVWETRVFSSKSIAFTSYWCCLAVGALSFISLCVSLSRSIGVNKPHYNRILFINWTIHAQCKKCSSEHKLWLVADDGDGATVTASTAFIYFKLLETYMFWIYVHILILKYTFHKRKTYAAHAFEQHTYILWAWMPLAEEHWARNVGDMLEANELDRNFWWFDLYVGERLKDTNWRTNAVTEYAVLFWHMRDCYRCNHPRRSKASHYFCCFVVVDEI